MLHHIAILYKKCINDALMKSNHSYIDIEMNASILICLEKKIDYFWNNYGIGWL